MDELTLTRGGLPTAVLDARECAAYLALEVQTVYRLARRGALPHVRLGRTVRFRREDLDRYLAECSVPARAD